MGIFSYEIFLTLLLFLLACMLSCLNVLLSHTLDLSLQCLMLSLVVLVLCKCAKFPLLGPFIIHYSWTAQTMLGSELGGIPNLYRLVSAILGGKSTTLERKVPQFDGDLGQNISHKNVSYDKKSYTTTNGMD